MNFAGNWVELEEIILSKVTQIQRANIVCSLSLEALNYKSSGVSTYAGITAETRKVRSDQCWSLMVGEQYRGEIWVQVI